MTLLVNNLGIARCDSEVSNTLLVDGLSFSLSRGRTLALCGPSGCGKTSVALSLLELLPPGLKQVSGTISIDGEPFSRQWRGSRIGYVFQEPKKAFHPLFSIGQLMAERLKLAGVSTTALESETLRWLDVIGLPQSRSRLNDRAHCFSGGELQRLMIAMTLAQEPDFLIADEPTSNLDVLVQGRILELLSRLQEEFQLGLLLITHDSRVAKSMTEDVVLMKPNGEGVSRS